jgi:pSer/pThr/pTyr-binding forkhead associated (FHA) protein
VNLLDPVKGHPLQTWEFDGRSVIRIGRADDNDVIVIDPLVSRVHAELVSDESGHWRIVSVGRNGTWVDGEQVSEPRPIGHGMVVQLGSSGPWMEIRKGRREPRGGETLSPMNDLSLPQIDEDLMQAEVSRIADAESFEDLRKQAQELKQARAETKLVSD